MDPRGRYVANMVAESLGVKVGDVEACTSDGGHDDTLNGFMEPGGPIKVRPRFSSSRHSRGC